MLPISLNGNFVSDSLKNTLITNMMGRTRHVEEKLGIIIVLHCVE